MNCNRNSRAVRRWLAVITVSLLLASAASAEWKEKVLYSFQGGATDGALPAGGVVFDAAGNLYGATTQGFGFCPPAQCGSVFQLSPPAKKGDPWTESVLHVFTGNSNGDGDTPVGGLVIDSTGNLYGTAGYGGTGGCVLLGTKVGCGIVYEMTPPQTKGGKWTEKVLYSFQGGKDGYLPVGNLTLDKAGSLYGATEFGGGFGSCDSPYYQYCGTIFKLSPPKTKGGKWKEKVLYSFKSGTDGANPNGGLVFDSRNAIYGTTSIGGGTNCQSDLGAGCGIVFELKPPAEKEGRWHEQVLYRFVAGTDGAGPNGGLILDTKGAVYGTTFGGGRENGTVFRLTPPAKLGLRWGKTLLYVFQSCSNVTGCSPGAGLAIDSAGNLFGTAGGGISRGGVVFRLKRITNSGPWPCSVLYSFTGSPDGYGPDAGLSWDKLGNLYGTTLYGGTGQACQGGCGTIFEATK